MKLTNNEQWILDYLKGKDYVSPTVIGKATHRLLEVLALHIIAHGLHQSVCGW